MNNNPFASQSTMSFEIGAKPEIATKADTPSQPNAPQNNNYASGFDSSDSKPARATINPLIEQSDPLLRKHTEYPPSAQSMVMFHFGYTAEYFRELFSDVFDLDHPQSDRHYPFQHEAVSLHVVREIPSINAVLLYCPDTESYHFAVEMDSSRVAVQFLRTIMCGVDAPYHPDRSDPEETARTFIPAQMMNAVWSEYRPEVTQLESNRASLGLMGITMNGRSIWSISAGSSKQAKVQQVSKYPNLSGVFFNGKFKGQLDSVYKDKDMKPAKVKDFIAAMEDGEIDIPEKLTPVQLRKCKELGIPMSLFEDESSTS